MLLNIFILLCWMQNMFAAAGDNKKDKFVIGMPRKIAPEHIVEVAAAHQMRALVFEVLKCARKSLNESMYYSDDEIAGFQDYPYDQDDVFRIDKGLLFCISKHNVPGIIYTRWGVWHFVKNCTSIGYDVGKLGIWEALCGNIIKNERIELKPFGRPASLGSERMYIIKKVGDITVQDPFEAFEPPAPQVSRLQTIVSGVSKYITVPTSAACSAVSKGLKKNPFAKKQTQQIIPQRYYPLNRYDSLPYTALLSDNEIYWLQLSQAYKKLYCTENKKK